MPKHADLETRSFYSSSSIDSTTLGGSWSVQQFYSIPVCPLPSPFLLLAYFVASKRGSENRGSCTEIRNILPDEWVRNIYKEMYWMVGWIISSSLRQMVGMYCILCLDIARIVVRINLRPEANETCKVWSYHWGAWETGVAVNLSFGRLERE